MADEGKKVKKDRKYKFKFVEMFAIQEGQPVDDIDSPKYITTKNFGTRLLHQIARVVYEEFEEDTAEVEKYDESGEPVYKKVKRTVEKMGAKGGWIERMGNLSQDGDCWVEQGAYVVGFAYVSDDANISGGAEVGDSAKISDEAQIGGKALVKDSAAVYGKAILNGSVEVADRATVMGRLIQEAKVYGNAFIGEDVEVGGEAKVYGNATVLSGYVRDKAEIFGDAMVEVGPVDDGDRRPTICDEAKVYGAALVMGGRVAGKSSVDGLARVSATIEDSIVTGNAALVGLSMSDITVKKSQMVGNVDFSGAGESDNGEAEIDQCKLVGNVRFDGKCSLVDSAAMGNVQWRGSLRESGLYGNALGSSANMKAMISTTIGNPNGPVNLTGVGSYGSGGALLANAAITSSTVDSAVVHCRGLISESGISGVVVSMGPIMKGGASGVTRGKVVNGSNGGVSMGPIVGTGNSGAASRKFENYPDALVTLGKGQSERGMLVSIGTDAETEVETYERLLADAQREAEEFKEEYEQLAELLAMEDEERAKFWDDIQKAEAENDKLVAQYKEALEEARRKQKEAEEEAIRKAEEEAENQRRFQDLMNRLDDEHERILREEKSSSLDFERYFPNTPLQS